MKTFKEIVEILKENNISEESFCYQDYEKKELGLGEIKRVDDYGGEDCGSEYYSVDHFVEHDVYIRVDAWYQSFHGADFYNSEFTQVFPTEVTRTEYLTEKQTSKIK